MEPPVTAMMNALEHGRGVHAPKFGTPFGHCAQGQSEPHMERAAPRPERAGDSILSSRHRHDTARPQAAARMRLEEQHNPI